MPNEPNLTFIEEGTIRHVSRKEAIVTLLNTKMQWLTSKEIATAFQIPYTTIHPDLLELASDGKITSRVSRKHKVGRRPTQWGSLKLRES